MATTLSLARLKSIYYLTTLLGSTVKPNEAFRYAWVSTLNPSDAVWDELVIFAQSPLSPPCSAARRGASLNILDVPAPAIGFPPPDINSPTCCPLASDFCKPILLE